MSTLEAEKNIHSSERRVVIWDGDNTLWPWMDYAVPAYEAMCEKIAKLKGKSIPDTATAMQMFYQSKGTIEHEGLIQGLEDSGFLEPMNKGERDRLIYEAKRAFSEVRHANLRLYPEIEDTVREVHENGFLQLLVTDAPERQAEARLHRCGLLPYIPKAYTMRSEEIRDLPAQILKDAERRAQRRASTPGYRPPEIHTLTEEKPDTDLERILSMTRDQISSRVTIIGDNRSKDMALAQRYNAVGIHAAYGASSQNLIDRLQVFAPPRVTNRNTQSASAKPDETQAHPAAPQTSSRIYTAYHPSDIRKILFSNP